MISFDMGNIGAIDPINLGNGNPLAALPGASRNTGPLAQVPPSKDKFIVVGLVAGAACLALFYYMYSATPMQVPRRHNAGGHHRKRAATKKQPKRRRRSWQTSPYLVPPEIVAALKKSEKRARK